MSIYGTRLSDVLASAEKNKTTVGLYTYLRSDAKQFGPLTVDDMIEEWHNNHSITVPLHEYLGMSWEEYQAWVMKG